MAARPIVSRVWDLAVGLIVIVALAACQRPEQGASAAKPPATDSGVKTPAAPEAKKENTEPIGHSAPSKKEEPKPAPETKWPRLLSQPTAAEADPRPAEAMPELGPPLVDHPEGLVRLDPKSPVYIDKQHKQVIVLGRICQRAVPLELFACPQNTKEHEAIVTVPAKAQLLHAGLLAVGAEPGATAHFHPKFTPARGQVIDIEVRWKQGGKLHAVPAQELVRNGNTKKAMAEKWVFAGSGFWTHPETGQRFYQAEGGDMICLSNFPGAMIDVNIASSSVNEELAYEAFTEHIPERGTVVTLVLTPK
jgi:hypothetical protein